MKLIKKLIIPVILGMSITTFYSCNPEDGIDGIDGVDGTNGTNGINGTNGFNSLIATTVEAAGTNCTNGGFKITFGADTNGNGTLDAAEITSTTYACNGVNGTNGPDGATFLIQTTAELAGDNCAAGGFKVETGIDTNADGTLASAEVTATTYICNGKDLVATPSIFENKSILKPLIAFHPQFSFVEAYSLIGSSDVIGDNNFRLGGGADGAGLVRNGENFEYIVNCEDHFSVARITLDVNFDVVKADYLLNSSVADYARQCSGTMWEAAIHGGTSDLFLSASEDFHFQVKGIDPIMTTLTPDADFSLPALGQFAWENAVPLPKDTYSGKTVILGGDDDSSGSMGQLILYYSVNGDADLTGGKIYVLRFKEISDGAGGVVTVTASTNYDESNLDFGMTYDVEFVEIVNGASMTQAEMETACLAVNAAQFMRVEDVDYQKGAASNALNTFFAVTGRGPGKGTSNDWGTVYKLELDATTPLTGQLTQIVSGNTDTNNMDGNLSELQSPDNICVTENFIYIQEDPNAFSRDHSAYIYQANLDGNNIKVVLELIERSDLGATEHSGEFGSLIDVSDKVGMADVFILATQPHYWEKTEFENVDGGSQSKLVHPYSAPPAVYKEGSQIIVLKGLPR